MTDTETVDPCPVCRDELWVCTGDTKRLACGHACHYRCLFDWLERRDSCPYCGKEGVLEKTKCLKCSIPYTWSISGRIYELSLSFVLSMLYVSVVSSGLLLMLARFVWSTGPNTVAYLLTAYAMHRRGRSCKYIGFLYNIRQYELVE
jgi:hypothetical protein